MRCRARKARLASLIEGGGMAVGHDGGSFPRLCHCEEGAARRDDPFPGEQKKEPPTGGSFFINHYPA